jgi:PhzF family phenazine biosynthesis protein
VRIPFYRIDAFTREAFGGNPAAVVALERWLDDRTLQAIATEENAPATAFFVDEGPHFGLRWFTSTKELELCGHATLASGHVLLNILQPERARANFTTQAGMLAVERDGDRLALDFPALPPQEQHVAGVVASALGVPADELWEADGQRAMAVLANPGQVRDLRPNLEAIAQLPFSALIVTAGGFEGDCDFVSRYFAPRYGIAEDFVTGSAHCVLTPYWAGRLGKRQLFARQLSSRGGELWVEDRGDRVRIAGQCVSIAEGALTLSFDSCFDKLSIRSG